VNDSSASEAGIAIPNPMKLDRTEFQADFAIIFFDLASMTPFFFRWTLISLVFEYFNSAFLDIESERPPLVRCNSSSKS